ncbi:CHC2 zinc finger domain-containing protein [Microbulbifer rhizosphaerae]|uniref:DNA primase catalytic core n=1 Tax=Microbulbifer rhizosphaerae TaxID=1562603 RepID=A0A7W4WET9_9GAMM|nr:CHC2 zinc finger domain-containing protein [Microbulbifer rhizosphaerae]MBB3062437.1 DNA primase catalytic core [Microbulbifer rhizosphaerae]MBB3062443.1 DNA primase catalytic core [Microbulbifer rhizosphaerae]
MARIADEVIERIKAEVSLERLVETFGVELKKHGKDKVGRCPFHDDRTPSLVVSPQSNLWHCLGACNTGGSVIDWVMKTQGISFRHAVEILRDDIPALAAPAGKPVKHSTAQKMEVLLSEDDEAQQLLNQVVDFYHEALLQSPEALDYLAGRGLGDRELIERFKLGFANRTLGYRLPAKSRKAGAEVRGKLQQVGVLRDSGHEHFNGSIVVPVFDSAGNVVEAYGRKIRDDLRKGTPKHLYLPGPHAGVWNAAALEGQKEVILCEALIDALSFWAAGYRNVTASYGTSGFTGDHLALFKEAGIQRVLIAYDRDTAGNNAAEKLAAQLQAEGFDCYRLLFPKGMDANQYAREVTPAGKSLGVVIRSAEWMGQGKPPERQLELEQQAPSALAADPARERFEQQAKSLAGQIDTLNQNAREPTPIPKPPPQPQPEPEPLPPAAAVPEAPSDPVPDAEVSEREVHFTFGDRKYRVRGLEKNKNYEVLKINLLASCGDNLHVDSFDFYAAKARAGFIKLAALELAQEERTLKTDLSKILLKLEELQEKLIQGSLQKTPESLAPELSESEQREALELLQSPDLLDRILSDFDRCGVVGEESNKLVSYLASASRKLERPLAVIIQSTSAAGKSSLMDAVLNLMPEEERVHYSAMTGQSLFYMGETNLKHKILAIAEEEGASNASYALKLLQSEGEITIASTGKDETTGELVTREYRVEGPVMLFLTTTAIDIDEELLNRCLVLTVNESREQTRAIHQAQRKRRTLEGLTAKLEKTQLTQLHRNAQRLLKPLPVINPYADRLTFLDDKTRTRRDHEKYLTLIDSIALLHQYQREIKTVHHTGRAIEYIEVTLSDIETANRLAHEVLGRTLDELPAQTRKLLKLIQQMVADECQRQRIEQKDYRFSRRQVRECTGWGNTQLKVHLHRLEEMEYLLTHRGGRGQSYEYELLFDGQGEDENRLMGLIDPQKLDYDKKKSGLKAEKSAPGRGQVGGRSDLEKSPEPSSDAASAETGRGKPKSTSIAKNFNGRTVVEAVRA